MGSQSSYFGDYPVQRNATVFPAPDTVTGQPVTTQPVTTQPVTTSAQCFQQGYFGAYLSRLVPIPHLIYVPLDRLSC